jgi:ubiquinone/menaquinone biosynthesis C-methylase UbiE
MPQSKLEFWNNRAEYAIHPGSDDFILKELELAFIAKHITDGISILDIGCGDGTTLLKLNEAFRIEGCGIDFSNKMVEKAIANSKTSSNLNFYQASALTLPENIGTFDVVFTQRCLINLDSFVEQTLAIRNIYNLLKIGGIFLMLESTVDGLYTTNQLRLSLGLEAILPPWHNTFFKIDEVRKLENENFKILNLEHISSTYHFLSRIVYGYLAKQNNEELKYDSDINLLCLKLPQNIGEFGPVKGFVWKRIQ